MTTPCDLPLPPCQPFEPVPAPPRRFRDWYSTGLVVPRGKPLQRVPRLTLAARLRPSIWWRIGRLLGGNLEKRPWLAKIFPKEKIEQVKERFRKYQFRAIVAGRYVYGLRPVLFFTSGASRMPLWKFVAADAIAAGVNAVIWVYLGDHFGDRIGDALHWAERSETILLIVAGALVAYFILEKILVHAKRWKESSPFVRWATGWKIAAIVGTVLLFIYLEASLRARGVSFRRLGGL